MEINPTLIKPQISQLGLGLSLEPVSDTKKLMIFLNLAQKKLHLIPTIWEISLAQ